jgi:3-deoxy-D-manno-octulosonic-acid transferase
LFWSGVYNALLLAAALPAVPYYGLQMLLTGKYRRSLGPKFGRIPPDLAARLQAGGVPRIWLHAVSVGEVTAAAPILEALRTRLPGAFLLLSTSTETGQEMARQLATAADALIYYPLDIPRVVRRVVSLANPDLFVPVETELWPNFLQTCHKRGTRVVMANGRLSPRSFRRYRATRFFWEGVLARLDAAGMISQTDAGKLASLGMPAGRIQVLGNAKYDGLASRVSPELRQETADRLGIAPGESVFVAGSTHEGEEAATLSVFQRLLKERPNFRLILVPRHVERAPAVAELIRRAGFADCIWMSEIRAGKKRNGERVILVDVIGELFKVYSLATVVFCGGSLVPKGGQNLLEAAAWGKVVLYGPSMEDFRDERALVEEAGAGISVADADALYARIVELLTDPDRLGQRGEAGRRAVAASRGAAQRYAALIADVLRHAPCGCASSPDPSPGA